jgi:hypothetical protein
MGGELHEEGWALRGRINKILKIGGHLWITASRWVASFMRMGGTKVGT